MSETQARWRTSQTNFEILRGSKSDVDAALLACLSLLAQTTGISYCRTWATEYGLLWSSRRTQRRSRRLSEKLRGHSCSANAVPPAIIFQLTARRTWGFLRSLRNSESMRTICPSQRTCARVTSDSTLLQMQNCRSCEGSVGGTALTLWSDVDIGSAAMGRYSVPQSCIAGLLCVTIRHGSNRGGVAAGHTKNQTYWCVLWFCHRC